MNGRNKSLIKVLTLFSGGQETTAMTNACIIFMLAHHQDVQNKAKIFFLFSFDLVVLISIVVVFANYRCTRNYSRYFRSEITRDHPHMKIYNKWNILNGLSKKRCDFFHRCRFSAEVWKKK